MRRVLVAIVVAAVAAGLSPVATAQESTDPSEPTPTLAPTEEGGAPVVPKAYRRVVRNAIADLQEFWDAEFPDAYGTEYEPIPRDSIYALTDASPDPECVDPAGRVLELSYEDVQGNAFWVNVCDIMVFDDVEYLPRKFTDFGPYAPAITLAHEWGHAIQDRIGLFDPPPDQRLPSIIIELQADCFAGAFTAAVAEGDTRLSIRGGDLDTALESRLGVADPIGTAAEDEGAHGDGFDRVSALHDGFTDGVAACAAYLETPPLITEIPFSDEQEAASAGNLAGDLVIPVTVDLLNDYYTQVAPDVYVPLTLDNLVEYDSSGPRGDLPGCGGSPIPRSELRNRVYYCLDDGYVGYDLPYLQAVYDAIGDFGVATLLANAWATYVQTLQGFPGVAENADNAVLGADCYTGGFAAAMYNGVLTASGESETGERLTISLSPGDLDETIQAIIDYNRARGVGSDLDATFLRVQTFKGGFLDGYQSCATFAQPAA